MNDLVNVKGLIIKVEPIGEYDRRIVLLTNDRGKVSAFAKGARRTNSKFVASTNMFCFGEYGLFNGRSSYSVNEAKVINYFAELRDDFVGAYYGMYLAEIADYFCHENINEIDMLKLLYQSLRALTSDKFSKEFVKTVYEIKAIMIQGEFGVKDNTKYDESTLYTLEFLRKTAAEKIYTFSVKDNILDELKEIAKDAVRYSIDRPLKSAEILSTLS